MALKWFLNLSVNTVDILLTNKKIHIFTSRPLPYRALRVLSYGLKFVPTLCRPNKKEFDEDVDRFFSSVRRRVIFDNSDRIDPENQFRIRNPIRRTDNVLAEKFCNSVHRDLCKAWDSLQAHIPCYHRNTISGDLRSLSDLAGDTSFFISATDKNLGVGVFDTDVIFGLMRDHLNCGAYRRLLSFKHACEFRDSAIDLFRRLRTRFENKVFEFITQNFDVLNVKFNSIYPLPKIHKPTLGIRPICPSFLSVTHHASIWVAFHLNRVVANLPSICTGTKSLVQALEVLRTDAPASDVRFITADVESLYPSIDTERGLSTVRFVLEKYSSLSSDKIFLLMEVLEIILRFNIFEFDGRFYLQTRGTAMGTPMAPPYANLFLFGLESAHFIGYAGIIFFSRYIDDLLFVITSNITEYVLHTLITLCPGIVFTYSVSDIKAVFLDLLITKSDKSEGKFEFCIYQKVINAYFYIPWFSDHPLHLKRGFIKGELLRYIRNCSYFEAYLDVQRQFYFRLRARGYPRSFLKRAFNEVSYSLRPQLISPSATRRADRVTPLFLCMQYSPFTTALDVRKILLSWWGLVDNMTVSLRDKPMIIFSKGNTILDFVRSCRKRSLAIQMQHPSSLRSSSSYGEGGGVSY